MHYHWKDTVYTKEQVRDRSKLGWIAQDVQTVFPKAVSSRPFFYPTEDPTSDILEDCLDLNVDQMYAVMYGALQKVISDCEALQSTVSDMARQISTMSTAR